MMRPQLPGKVQLLTLYCIGCVRVRFGQVCNEITSCFPCFESAMEDKITVAYFLTYAESPCQIQLMSLTSY